MARLTAAQQRLVDEIRAFGDEAEYWPVVNEWVQDSGTTRSLALRNINRTVEALIRSGHVTLTEDGLFRLMENKHGE